MAPVSLKVRERMGEGRRCTEDAVGLQVPMEKSC